MVEQYQQKHGDDLNDNTTELEKYKRKTRLLFILIIIILVMFVFFLRFRNTPSTPNIPNIPIKEPDILLKEKVEKPTREAISQPMFGIFLGETLDSLRRRFVVGAAMKDGVSDSQEVQSDNPNVRVLTVSTYHQQIYCIDVIFTDVSKQNFLTIKEELEKKYKGNVSGDILGLFTNFYLRTIIDGVKIKIILKYSRPNYLFLFYYHEPLLLMVEEERKKQRADKFKKGL